MSERQFAIYSCERICDRTGRIDTEQLARELDDIEGLRKAVADWAKTATPGQIFMTRNSIVVCVNGEGMDHECPDCLNEDHIDYDDLVIHGSTKIITRVYVCRSCGTRWEDFWGPMGRKILEHGNRVGH